MMRRSLTTIIFVILGLTVGCQTYTESLEKSVDRADEVGAIAMLKAIAVAQRTYSLSNNGEFGTLQQLADGGFLSQRYVTNNPVRDYVITLNVSPKRQGQPEGSFTINADPERPAERFGRYLYLDSTSNTIHVNTKEPATASDPALQ
jgi:hypothetical protein